MFFLIIKSLCLLNFLPIVFYLYVVFFSFIFFYVQYIYRITVSIMKSIVWQVIEPKHYFACRLRTLLVMLLELLKSSINLMVNLLQKMMKRFVYTHKYIFCIIFTSVSGFYWYTMIYFVTCFLIKYFFFLWFVTAMKISKYVLIIYFKNFWKFTHIMKLKHVIYIAVVKINFNVKYVL